MKRAACIALVVWLFTMSSAIAQQPAKPQPTDAQIQELQQLDRAIAAIDQMKLAAKALASTRHYKCLVAFAHEPFCSCLRDELPLSATLENYVTISTSTKEELGYDSASKEDRGFVDATLKARDACTVKSYTTR